MARHKELPRAGWILSGVFLCVEISEIEKADAAYTSDVRIAFRPNFSSPSLTFRDIRFGKYRAAFENGFEALLTCSVPHAADKFGQHGFSSKVHAILCIAAIHSVELICRPYRMLISANQKMPVRVK